jgi:hypothetical protein
MFRTPFTLLERARDRARRFRKKDCSRSSSMKRTDLSKIVAGAVGIVAAGAIAIACGGENGNLPPPPPPPPPPSATAATPPPATSGSAAPAPPPAPPVTLLPSTPSPDPTTLPTVRITAPSMDQLIATDKVNDFSIKLDVKNWQTAVGSTHVHLILDNKPYKPIYDTKKPIKMSDLSKEPLAEGQHVLVAFPSRANHESVKTKGALAVMEFFVGTKKGDKPVDIKKPMLIYSRPKGDYNGDMANHVLIDFYLANVTLADGKDHVHISVTGGGIDKELAADVNKWGTPYTLDNLQIGSYTVKLDLLGTDGQLVAGPWNSTTRTIKIDHDAPSPAPMNMAPGAASAPSAAPSAKP